MSQENVEIVRRAYEASNARSMDALRELYDPDARIVTGIEGSDARTLSVKDPPERTFPTTQLPSAV